MKKGFKKFIWWNVVLTIPLTGLLLAAPFLIDVNRFKGPILKAVNSNINGEVTLGHISLKLFPFIGVSLEDLTVRNLPQSPYASVPLLKLSRLDLRVELKTILQRKVVASLELKSPEIAFIQTAEGSNVDALIKKQPKPVEKKPSPLDGLITSFSVPKFSIQNGSLEYRATAKPPIRLTKVGVECALLPPKAILKGLDFDLWGGHFSGNATVNTGAKQAWEIAFKVSGLDMNAALTDLAGEPNILSGAGGLELKLNGQGTTAEAVKKSVSGEGSLSLKDGILKTVNIAGGVFSKELLNGMKVAGGALNLPVPGFVGELTSEQGTKLGNLSTSFTIEKGVITLPPLKLADARQTIEMGGSVSLDTILDMKGTYLLSKEQTESWLTDPKVRAFLVDDQGQFNVPFTMTGPAARPTIVPDVSSVTQRVTKAAGTLVKEEVQRRVTEEAGKQLQKAAPQVKPEELLKKLPKLF